MEPELHDLEALLQKLRPSALDERQLARFGAAMTGTLGQTSPETAGVEAALDKLVPARPRQELLGRLEGVVEGVPFPVDEKVVLFPRGTSGSAPAKGRRSWLAAAAAVAILGAASALFLSPGHNTQTEASAARAERAMPASQPDRRAFVPAGFGSDVSGTDDLGVVWSESRQPMRIVRVVYRDRVSFINDQGARVEMEKPRVEYVVIPEKID